MDFHVRRLLDVNDDFGGPIDEKVSDLGGLEGLEGLEMYGFSGLERCYEAILYCLRLGRFGNAWIFRFGRLLCSNSLLFEAWKAWKCIDFQVWKAAM